MSQAMPYESSGAVAAERAASCWPGTCSATVRRAGVVKPVDQADPAPNINCLPQQERDPGAAKVADLLHHAMQFGILTELRRIAAGYGQGASARRRDGRGADRYAPGPVPEEWRRRLIMGDGRFVGAENAGGASSRDGGTRVLTGERVFLNLGDACGRSHQPPASRTLGRSRTSRGGSELDRLPAHLIVLGGGYVGLEFAQSTRRFGSRVDGGRARGRSQAGREDPDVADAASDRLFPATKRDRGSPFDRGAPGRGAIRRRRAPPRPDAPRRASGSGKAATSCRTATERTPNTAGIRTGRRRRAARWAGGATCRSTTASKTSTPGRLGDRRMRQAATVPRTWPEDELSRHPHATTWPSGSRIDARPAHPLLPLHGPAIAAGWPERKRSPLEPWRSRVRVAKLPMAAVLRTRTTGETLRLS